MHSTQKISITSNLETVIWNFSVLRCSHMELECVSTLDAHSYPAAQKAQAQPLSHYC